MSYLFVILFLLSGVSLFLGLIKPSIFSRFLGTNPSRKKVGLINVSALVLFFVLIGLTSSGTNKSNTATPTPVLTLTPVVTQKIQAEKPDSPTATKTDQQILEENLMSIVSDIGGSDMSYRGLQVEKSDPDRPKDTKMITVSVNIKSFFNKNSLMRDTGKLSSSLFKAVYNVQSMNAYDVLVWYYGETTDRYGNKKNDVVLTYAIDKATFEKINWQNFDQSNLCSFLKQEAKSTGTFDTACNELVNLQ